MLRGHPCESSQLEKKVRILTLACRERLLAESLCRASSEELMCTKQNGLRGPNFLVDTPGGGWNAGLTGTSPVLSIATRFGNQPDQNGLSSVARRAGQHTVQKSPLPLDPEIETRER
jgi:hypothetical protein